MITNLLKSFFIGALSYFLAMFWISWGDLPPTMKTNGVAYGLNVVMLIFWITSFTILERKNK